MRSKLRELAKSGRHKFKAKVIITKKKMLLKVLLLNVTCDGEEVADHTWIKDGRLFEGFHSNDVIEFEAEVDSYIKGYWGTDKKAIRTKPLELDYQLCRVTNIRKVGEEWKTKNTIT